MRAADLLRKYRQAINPPYSGNDFLVIGATIFILLVVPLTVLVSLQARDLTSLAKNREKSKAKITETSRATTTQIGAAFGPQLDTSGLSSTEKVATPLAVSAQVQLDSESQAFLNLINGYRASSGLPTLFVSPTLTNAAVWMAADMATKNYFSHTDSLGRDPFQRMAAFGYGYNAWKGENLAAACTTGQACFDTWKNSPGHNENMLNSNFRVIGIARAYNASSTYGWYWTTDFGGYDDSGQTTPTGSIQFRVREVNSSGQPIGFVYQATAKLTDTNGNPLGPTATSDSSGWVRFYNVASGKTYGILAYKPNFVGKSKQYWPPSNTCGESFTTSTIPYADYTAAWDNNVPVNANSPTWCHDLGLKSTIVASCDTSYPTNRFHACVYDRSNGVYLGAWDEGDLGTPTNNKTLVNHNWGGGTVAFGKADNVRIIWRGKIKVPASARYKIILCSDDGSRVDVGIATDSSPVWDINFWGDHADSCMTKIMSMTSGVYSPVKLEWYENGGGANIYFEYQKQ